jgi:hypothetical protein
MRILFSNLPSISTLGKFENGNRFGKLSFVLYERFRNRNFLARFYVFYYEGVHGWIHPVQECVKPLMHAHKVGLETGDNEFAMVGANMFCTAANFDVTQLFAILDLWIRFLSLQFRTMLPVGNRAGTSFSFNKDGNVESMVHICFDEAIMAIRSYLDAGQIWR